MRQNVCGIRVFFILNIRDVSIYVSCSTVFLLVLILQLNHYVSCSTAKSAPVASMLIL
eukprot:SAG11_NODE_37_length_21777_cov_4.523711_8_plen_58_part_00